MTATADPASATVSASPWHMLLAAPRCAGVEHAVEVVGRLSERAAGAVFVHGQIVRNTRALADLEGRGAAVIGGLDEVPDPPPPGPHIPALRRVGDADVPRAEVGARVLLAGASATPSACHGPGRPSRRSRPVTRSSPASACGPASWRSSPAPAAAACELTSTSLTAKVQAAFDGFPAPLRVAVMGCVVNGPGAAREANLRFSGGNGKDQIVAHGQVIRTVPEHQVVDAVLEEALALTEKEGTG